MNVDHQWKAFWEKTAEHSNSDFEYDHGRSPRRQAIEDLSNQELISFVGPKPSEILFDAGCGTGANILLMYSKVSRIIAMDYNHGAVERCQKRIVHHNMQNVYVMQGSITQIPLPNCSVDKIMCMSVLQYLNDDEVRSAFKEFIRISKNEGTMILHVKNFSSVYLSTLWMLKQAKSMFRKRIKMEYFRPFRWYIHELTSLGFEIVDYNSFNWFIIEGMPQSLRSAMQKFEFEHFKSAVFRCDFIRRHGSDLKIKASILKRS